MFQVMKHKCHALRGRQSSQSLVNQQLPLRAVEDFVDVVLCRKLQFRFLLSDAGTEQLGKKLQRER